MRENNRFDEVARQIAPESSGVALLILDRDLRIRGFSSAYEQATLRDGDELRGEYLFDAFPDNPNDPLANGTANLAASLETAMRSGQVHNMRIQRYDIRDPAAPDQFLPKVWSPTNTPLIDHGELIGAAHRVEEISESRQVLAELARNGRDHWSPAELLHICEALHAVEDARSAQRQRAMQDEIEQLRRAIETRDTIGQAKGMLMERFNIDAAGAFQLLARLSQDTNTRLEEIARQLVDIDHPLRPD
ncbi:histidine kinase [Mycobacterium rhizamassiliense]|jgi:hypothetical protein|uniref:Histidine kinase n=1 Tax=Mycobacterium rhizamassiliense TaxID=1841860 RepID=A0A2U3NVR5_9MYCO|nr:ANTAR domain-containing protein [Mycobacterium rhizamassiliense]SPM35606.1 histidine kinase [Mycobacterium rhizamassiliense]